MSDHCDWQQLNDAIKATGAENIYVTHGYKSIYAKWLTEAYGLNAVEVDTLYENEGEELQEESLTDTVPQNNIDDSNTDGE